MKESKLLSTHGVADLLQTSVQAVRSKIYRGEIPEKMIIRKEPKKGKMLFRRTDIERLFHIARGGAR